MTYIARNFDQFATACMDIPNAKFKVKNGEIHFIEEGRGAGRSIKNLFSKKETYSSHHDVVQQLIQWRHALPANSPWKKFGEKGTTDIRSRDFNNTLAQWSGVRRGPQEALSNDLVVDRIRQLRHFEKQVAMADFGYKGADSWSSVPRDIVTAQKVSAQAADGTFTNFHRADELEEAGAIFGEHSIRENTFNMIKNQLAFNQQKIARADVEASEFYQKITGTPLLDTELGVEQDGFMIIGSFDKAACHEELIGKYLSKVNFMLNEMNRNGSHDQVVHGIHCDILTLSDLQTKIDNHILALSHIAKTTGSEEVKTRALQIIANVPVNQAWFHQVKTSYWRMQDDTGIGKPLSTMEVPRFETISPAYVPMELQDEATGPAVQPVAQPVEKPYRGLSHFGASDSSSVASLNPVDEPDKGSRPETPVVSKPAPQASGEWHSAQSSLEEVVRGLPRGTTRDAITDAISVLADINARRQASLANPVVVDDRDEYDFAEPTQPYKVVQ